MKDHLSNSEIIKVVSGLAGKKEVSEVNEHILQCGECRRTYDLFSKVANEPMDNNQPSDRVRKSVIDSWHVATSSQNDQYSWKRFISKQTAGFAAAGLVFVVGAFLVLNKAKSPIADYPHKLIVQSVTGIISVNGQPAVTGITVIEKIRITTNSKSSLLVSGTDGYSVYISPETDAEFFVQKKDGYLHGKIYRGQIISSSQGGRRYEYSVNGYTVYPSGTEFFIRSAENSVSVGVNGGRVSISNRESGTIAVASGELWESLHPGDIRKMGAIETKVFSMISVNKSGAVDANSKLIKKETVESSQAVSSQVENKDMNSDNRNIERDRRSDKIDRQDLEDIKRERKEQKNARERGKR